MPINWLVGWWVALFFISFPEAHVACTLGPYTDIYIAAHVHWILQGQNKGMCVAGPTELVEGQYANTIERGQVLCIIFKLWLVVHLSKNYIMTPIETCINNLCNEPVLYVLQAHPKLHQSLQTIVAQRVQLPSKKEELLGNFKLSVRGSIRKPPNVVLDSQLLTTFHFAFPVQLVDASLFVRPVYLASLLLRTWISSILQLQSLDSTLDVAQFVACLKFIVCWLDACCPTGFQFWVAFSFSRSANGSWVATFILLLCDSGEGSQCQFQQGWPTGWLKGPGSEEHLEYPPNACEEFHHQVHSGGWLWGHTLEWWLLGEQEVAAGVWATCFEVVFGKFCFEDLLFLKTCLFPE